jgi:hypothetical protein
MLLNSTIDNCAREALFHKLVHPSTYGKWTPEMPPLHGALDGDIGLRRGECSRRIGPAIKPDVDGIHPLYHQLEIDDFNGFLADNDL